MSGLWPRLGAVPARALHAEHLGRSVKELARSARHAHPLTTFAATGGARISERDVAELVAALRGIAEDFGYPVPADDSDRIGFDRAAAEELYARMDITTVEAANNGVWNFLAVVAAPDLVKWRWPGSANIERWICTDRTRHMFARLWWQALTFAVPRAVGEVDHSLLRALSESDLNQITERRSIAGNPKLAQALARLIVDASSGTSRRDLLRDITPRLRRRLAFIDFSGLSDQLIEDHVRSLVHSPGES